eukprot:756929-Prymnesium_polylepis.1
MAGTGQVERHLASLFARACPTDTQQGAFATAIPLAVASLSASKAPKLGRLHVAVGVAGEAA